jgi:O-antigen ligase
VASWLEGPVVDSANRHNIESDPLNFVVNSVLLTAGLIVLVSRRRTVGRFLQANGPILLFFSYCALSALWSDYPDAAFRKWIRSVGDLVVVLIILTDVEPVVALKRLLTRTGFVLLPLSVLFIKYYPDLGRSYANDWELMYTGVTDHKNSLGVICMIFGLGSLFGFLEHYRTRGELHPGRHLFAQGTIFATAMWLLWMAQSMTSSSCFLMAAALIVVTSRHAQGRTLGGVHLCVATLVCLALFALFFDPGGSLVASLGRNPTLTGRTAIWRQVVSMPGNPLFGTGFESFWLGDRLQRMWINNPGARLNEAHNGYLEVYLNLGWFGAALLATLIVTGYRNVIVAFRQDKHVGGLKLAYFVAAVIYSLTEAGFRMISPTWIFFLLAATAVPKPSMLSAPNLNKQINPPYCWVGEEGGA